MTETNLEQKLERALKVALQTDRLSSAVEQWVGPSFMLNPEIAAAVLIEGLQEFRKFTIENKALGTTGTDYDEELKKAAIVVATKLFEYALDSQCEGIQVQDAVTGKLHDVVAPRTNSMGFPLHADSSGDQNEAPAPPRASGFPSTPNDTVGYEARSQADGCSQGSDRSFD